MPKISSISRNELIYKLRKFGFKGPYKGSKHAFMIKNTLRLTIPNPHKEDISVDLLKRILKQAGISQDEWSKI
ncbi:MAG: type II toxin-antitoxin system HicA family toxin [Athalassotoga sp.]|uniref:type II toxin-antitoxin system HicA family toxin n=1 Tax=Athalassotoga sp. TaxID=2022597 RepID=UPI003D014917